MGSILFIIWFENYLISPTNKRAADKYFFSRVRGMGEVIPVWPIKIKNVYVNDVAFSKQSRGL